MVLVEVIELNTKLDNLFLSQLFLHLQARTWYLFRLCKYCTIVAAFETGSFKTQPTANHWFNVTIDTYNLGGAPLNIKTCRKLDTWWRSKPSAEKYDNFSLLSTKTWWIFFLLQVRKQHRRGNSFSFHEVTFSFAETNKTTYRSASQSSSLIWKVCELTLQRTFELHSK